MPPLGVMALAVAVGQHRFWVSASKVPPFLVSMSTATRLVPLGCRFILIPMLPVLCSNRRSSVRSWSLGRHAPSPRGPLQPPERLRPCPKGPCRRGRGTLGRPVPRTTDPGEPGPARGKHPALELAVSDHRVPLGQATRVLRGGLGHGIEPDPNRRLAGPALITTARKKCIVGQAFQPDSEPCQAGKPDLLLCRGNRSQGGPGSRPDRCGSSWLARGPRGGDRHRRLAWATRPLPKFEPVGTTGRPAEPRPELQARTPDRDYLGILTGLPILGAGPSPPVRMGPP